MSYKPLQLKDLVGTIIASLVDNPDEIEIEESSGERTIVLNVRVLAEDIGKVVGKRGHIIENIRNLVKNIASREQKRINIWILD
jgi:uncharacterized protein